MSTIDLNKTVVTRVGAEVQKKHILYFVMGWLMDYFQSVRKPVEGPEWTPTFKEMSSLVTSYLDGNELPSAVPQLVISCAQEAARAFGRQTVITTKVEPLPEIHHDRVPRSDDPWISSFTPL